MLEAAEREFPHDRPSFMAVLGLLPPYELADVKAAYRDKVLVAHPDRGGDPADFLRLQQAYDQAVEYATFRRSRRAWMAAMVEPHLQQEQVIAEVLRRSLAPVGGAAPPWRPSRPGGCGGTWRIPPPGHTPVGGGESQPDHPPDPDGPRVP